ncbi:MAG: LysE family transporter [Ginsengibacter sp.]
MIKFLKIFGWGLTISFLGSLPLGTMNVAATHIAIQQGVNAGLIYASGSMMIEIIVVRFTLVGIKWLISRNKIFRLLELSTIALLFALAVASFIAAYKMAGFSNSLPILSFHPFWTGAILSATNPLHIPFWLGWSTVLFDKGILKPVPVQYNFFVLGIGTGTMLGFMVFIFGGNYFVSQIAQHQNILNWIIGIVLLATGIIQAKKIISVPASVRYKKILLEHPNY